VRGLWGAGQTAAGWLNFSRSYTYDSLNRLSTMSSASDPGGCTGLSWTYDAWGNRTDQTTTAGSCGQFHASVNAKNQLIDPVNNSYQYDAAGNVIYDGSHHYLYDAENRLIQVDPNSGYCSSQGNTSTAAACYVYDALGRRVVKLPASGPWTQYVYDLSDNVISEYGEGCGPTCWARGYVYFAGQRIAEYANSTTYFAHNDHLGSPRLLTDVSAQYVTDCYDFLPFGERNLPTTPCRSSSPPSPPQANTSHLFTGKERDSESGLDNFEARYYGSSMGRFMSPDPDNAGADLMAPQSWNAYSYVLNNPLNAIDPTGLDCVYLNDAGTGVDGPNGVDRNSNSGECRDNGGTWFDGTINSNSVRTDPNSDWVSAEGVTDFGLGSGNLTASVIPF
jgi:RHS repeat-associated protein